MGVGGGSTFTKNPSQSGCHAVPPKPFSARFSNQQKQNWIYVALKFLLFSSQENLFHFNSSKGFAPNSDAN